MNEDLKLVLDELRSFKTDVNAKFDEVNARLNKMDSRLTDIEAKLDENIKLTNVIFDQVARNCETLSDIQDRLKKSEAVTKDNCYEIAALKTRAI